MLSMLAQMLDMLIKMLPIKWKPQEIYIFDSDLFFIKKSLYYPLNPVFKYIITFCICVLVMWIHKGYCVVKKLEWNVILRTRVTNQWSH